MKPLERILKTIHCFLSAVRDLLTVCVICLILGTLVLFAVAAALMSGESAETAEDRKVPLSESHTVMLTLSSGLADADDQETPLEQFIRELSDDEEKSVTKDTILIAESLGKICRDDSVKNVILSLDDFGGGSLGNMELIGKGGKVVR